MGHPLSTKLDATLRYASGLYGLATAVLTDIANALSDAAAAQTAADAAQSTADSATTAAAAAQSTANGASTAAAAAQSTANSATTSASSAQTTANAAQTTANGASTAAAAAQSTANSAQTTATAAQTTANTNTTAMTAHKAAGGTEHPVATASVAGFMPSAHFSKVAALAAGQATTVGRLTVDAVHETPAVVAYSAVAITLDLATKNDFAIETLGGDADIDFSNAAAGRQGLIAVKQGAGGTSAVFLTAPAGWTLYRDSGTADLDAATGAGALTIYTYACLTVGTTNMMFIGKLKPVAA